MADPGFKSDPCIKCGLPEGAFYAFPDVKELISACGFENSKQLADTLLYDYGVVLSNGSAFGVEGYLRLSYANSLEAIQAAVARIERMRIERSKR